MGYRIQLCKHCGQRMHFKYRMWGCRTEGCLNNWEYKAKHSVHFMNKFARMPGLQNTDPSWDNVVRYNEDSRG